MLKLAALLLCTLLALWSKPPVKVHPAPPAFSPCQSKPLMPVTSCRHSVCSFTWWTVWSLTRWGMLLPLWYSSIILLSHSSEVDLVAWASCWFLLQTVQLFAAVLGCLSPWNSLTHPWFLVPHFLKVVIIIIIIITITIITITLTIIMRNWLSCLLAPFTSISHSFSRFFSIENLTQTNLLYGFACLTL